MYKEQSQARFFIMRQAVSWQLKTPSLRPLRVLGASALKYFSQWPKVEKQKDVQRAVFFKSML
jgi:hypothetical protein